MLAQQLVHSQSFTFEERRFLRKQTQIQLLIDQASFCRDRCLLGYPQALKLHQLSQQQTEGSADAKVSPIPLDLSEGESKCLQNCVEKVFVSERLLKGYLPSRFSKLSFKAVEDRLNNPTDSHGQYFQHTSQ